MPGHVEGGGGDENGGQIFRCKKRGPAGFDFGFRFRSVAGIVERRHGKDVIRDRHQAGDEGVKGDAAVDSDGFSIGVGSNDGRPPIDSVASDVFHFSRRLPRDVDAGGVDERQTHVGWRSRNGIGAQAYVSRVGRSAQSGGDRANPNGVVKTRIQIRQISWVE